MNIAVKFQDEEGNVHIGGKLTPTEVSFLLQFAINTLMVSGVHFAFEKEPTSDDEVRFEVPEGMLKH